jgi:hypothetical protein
MPWVRKRRVTKAAADAVRQAAGPTRWVLPDGTVEETSAAMGRVLIIPADPRPAALDLGEGASGWQRLREFRRRLGGG